MPRMELPEYLNDPNPLVEQILSQRRLVERIRAELQEAEEVLETLVSDYKSFPGDPG